MNADATSEPKEATPISMPASTLAADALAEVLATRLGPDSLIRRREPMARRTTMRVGGVADLLVEPGSEKDLAIVLEETHGHGLPWRVIGRGSNLLVRDAGIRGVVICLARPAFSVLEVEGPMLRCGAGCRLKDVSNEARRRGLAGLEFLAGIPGSVGGALRMNAGAWKGETFAVLDRIRYMAPSGSVLERPAKEVPAQYRRCDLFREHIALGAVFRGTVSTPELVEATLNDLNARRWATQPAAPSAGCIFKNPSSIPAGRLIDELGLKGTRVGGAMVSMEHGNFIVTDGQASATDVLALIELIRGKAQSQRGVLLETEVEILGE